MEKIIITISPEGHVSVERQGTSNLSGEIMEKVCNALGEGMEYAMCINTFAEKRTNLEIMLGL